MFLTDVELVSEVPDANARELRADEAEDPVGCDCGGCTSGMRWLAVGVDSRGWESYLVRMDRELISAW
jgi:hypothetical protein